MGPGSRTFFYSYARFTGTGTFPNHFFARQLMNLPLDIESYLKKIFPSYDLNGIFFMFYKHNWNILNKSQVYSSPKMFFLSLATCVYKLILFSWLSMIIFKLFKSVESTDFPRFSQFMMTTSIYSVPIWNHKGKNRNPKCPYTHIPMWMQWYCEQRIESHDPLGNCKGKNRKS